MGSMFSASSSKEAALRLTGEERAVRGVSVRVMVRGNGSTKEMNEWLCVVDCGVAGIESNWEVKK